MKISNKNTRKRFYTVFFTLLAISILDLVLANLSAGEEYFWGYLFLVNIALVVLIYFVLGKPIFEFYFEDDLIEFDSEWLTGLFNERLFIKGEDLMNFHIRNGLIWKKISLEYYVNGKVQKKEFSLTFLSSSKVKELKTRLSQLVLQNQEAEEQQLFI